MRPTIDAARAAALAPRVADQPLDQIELAFLQHLADIHRRPAHDQFEHALQFR